MTQPDKGRLCETAMRAEWCGFTDHVMDCLGHTVLAFQVNPRREVHQAVLPHKQLSVNMKVSTHKCQHAGDNMQVSISQCQQVSLDILKYARKCQHLSVNI